MSSDQGDLHGRRGEVHGAADQPGACATTPAAQGGENEVRSDDDEPRSDQDGSRDAGGAVPVREVVTLSPEPLSAGRARRIVRDVLGGAGRDDCIDAAEIACTELVTNAILHAHTDIELTVEVGEDVYVEVRDFNVTLPSQRNYDVQSATGRGLSLVASLTDEHGITASGVEGKTVWFRLGGAGVTEGEDVLSAWGDGDWDIAELMELPTRNGRLRTVRLLGLPPLLWFAAREHHDALLRELFLYQAYRSTEGTEHDTGAHDPSEPSTREPSTGEPSAREQGVGGNRTEPSTAERDAAATSRARSLVDAAVQAAMPDGKEAVLAVPTGQPGELPHLWDALDVELEVAPDAGPAFVAKRTALDTAERLARAGELLAHPGLPEIVALRDWECDEVASQLAGREPVPWQGTEHDRFAGVLQPDAGDGLENFDEAAVRDASRGVVAIDDADCIVAVSRPLARMTGWGVRDLVGRRMTMLVPPRFREAHVAWFTRHLSTGDADVLGVELTLPVLCYDGTEVMSRYRIERVPAVIGRSAYLIWIEPADDEP